MARRGGGLERPPRLEIVENVSSGEHIAAVLQLNCMLWEVSAQRWPGTDTPLGNSGKRKLRKTFRRQTVEKVSSGDQFAGNDWKCKLRSAIRKRKRANVSGDLIVADNGKGNPRCSGGLERTPRLEMLENVSSGEHIAVVV
jgi:hypothetical protein